MDGYLTTEQIAERIGVAPGTIHTYKKRGTIPPPDQYAGRTPMWAVPTIEQWIKSRPGQGWRKGHHRSKTPAPRT